jgi:uncharacterized protein (TIGR02217 family)
MAVYDDIVFPTDISFHSPGGPRFLTRMAKLPSGWHQADIKRDTPLCEWDVGYGARQAGKIYDLYKLFMVVRGQGHIFLYKYWADFKSAHGDQFEIDITPIDQILGTAVAGQKDFQLIKTYTVGSASLVKTIYKPKAGTLRVSVNGVEELAGWTMNASTGVISRSVGLSAGQIVRAGYEYFHPAKFASDDFDGSFLAWQTGEVNVHLEEVRLTP